MSVAMCSPLLRPRLTVLAGATLLARAHLSASIFPTPARTSEAACAPMYGTIFGRNVILCLTETVVSHCIGLGPTAVG